MQQKTSHPKLHTTRGEVAGGSNNLVILGELKRCRKLLNTPFSHRSIRPYRRLVYLTHGTGKQATAFAKIPLQDFVLVGRYITSKVRFIRAQKCIDFFCYFSIQG